MIRLISIELRRMWRRMMPWVMLLGVSAAIVFGGVSTFVTHSNEVPDVGDVEAQIAADVAMCRTSTIAEWTAWSNGELQGIDAGYEEYLSSFDSADAMADDQCNPDYFQGYFEDPRFCLVSLYEPSNYFRQACPDLDVGQIFEPDSGTFTIDGITYRSVAPIPGGIVPSTGLFLFVIAAVLGASFIGAEYKSGTIETTLLWEPRRVRVLGSKLAAVSLSAFAIHVTLLGLLVLAMLPAAHWRGSTAGADADFWYGVAGVILRGGVAAAATAAIALSVSVLTRNTVGGVAVVLGYTAIASPLLTMVLLRGLRPFDLNENLVAFATGGEVGRFVRADGELVSVYSHGVTRAAITVAVYVVLAVTVSTFVFRRRDVD